MPELLAEMVCVDGSGGVMSPLTSLGITATHSLAFEPKAPTHAKFDKAEATNRWALSSRTLRQLMDHFGPGVELLDINTDDHAHVVNFTCFTEKVQKRGANSNEGEFTMLLAKPSC